MRGRGFLEYSSEVPCRFADRLFWHNPRVPRSRSLGYPTVHPSEPGQTVLRSNLGLHESTNEDGSAAAIERSTYDTQISDRRRALRPDGSVVPDTLGHVDANPGNIII